jgi:hypothetical protein
MPPQDVMRLRNLNQLGCVVLGIKAEDRAQNFDPRMIRRVGRVRRASADISGNPIAIERPEKFVNQAALAQSGLAGDDHDLPFAVAGTLDQLPQSFELDGATGKLCKALRDAGLKIRFERSCIHHAEGNQRLCLAL